MPWLPIGAESPIATISEPAASSPASLETKPRLLVLFKELQELSLQWREMGEFLELTDEELDRVESESGPAPSKCMKSMLRVWLSREEPPPTWQEILEVVEVMDSELASKLCQWAFL